MTRKAITLIEILVVIGIIGLLVGLLLPAVQKIRVAALEVQNKNNHKQIGLAAHHYAEANDGRLPGLFNASLRTPTADHGFFVTLLPYMELGNYFDVIDGAAPTGQPTSPSPRIRGFLNPLDFTTRHQVDAPIVSTDRFFQLHLISYAVNAQVCRSRRGAHLGHSFADGLSQTILVAEHYAGNCGGWEFNYIYLGAGDRRVRPENPPEGTRATFADGGPEVDNGYNGNDYYPITAGNPPTSSSAPPMTFQTRPSVQECDPRLPNSPAPNGLTVLLADGSVRTLSARMDPTVFWGAVTPRGGETIRLD